MARSTYKSKWSTYCLLRRLRTPIWMSATVAFVPRTTWYRHWQKLLLAMMITLMTSHLAANDHHTKFPHNFERTPHTRARTRTARQTGALTRTAPPHSRTRTQAHAHNVRRWRCFTRFFYSCSTQTARFARSHQLITLHRPPNARISPPSPAHHRLFRSFALFYVSIDASSLYSVRRNAT